MEIDKVAFEGPNTPVSYLKEPNSGDALVEILKEGNPERKLKGVCLICADFSHYFFI
jgi:hypothetical protein